MQRKKGDEQGCQIMCGIKKIQMVEFGISFPLQQGNGEIGKVWMDLQDTMICLLWMYHIRLGDGL